MSETLNTSISVSTNFEDCKNTELSTQDENVNISDRSKEESIASPSEFCAEPIVVPSTDLLDETLKKDIETKTAEVSCIEKIETSSSNKLKKTFEAHESMLPKDDVNESSEKLSENSQELLSAQPDANNASTERLSLQKSEVLSSSTEFSKLVENEASSLQNHLDSTNSTDEYSDHVSYNDDGSAIYTDPKTNYKYKWCTENNRWLPLQQNVDSDKQGENAYENEHYKWCSETNQWILKNTESEPQTETEFYKWDATLNQWIPKQQQISPERVYGTDEDGQRIYTDKDGSVFFWDVIKKAWFPKIDDDFMARYQMNYGFIDNTTSAVDESEKAPDTSEINTKLDSNYASVGVKRKVPAEPPKWFDLNPEQNTKVYVSNLPLDITVDEFAEVMSKCGMIMRDPKTQKYKLKLYTETDGQVKGDGLCDYIKVESVDLALNILDGYDVRGHKIKVQQAKFQMRGEYNPALKPKRQKKDKEKLQKIKEKLFDWRPEKMRGERSKNEKVVIIKNLFTPELFDKEVQLIIDYQNDLRDECSKCGSVRKVVIYDRHPEGVAQVNMASPEEADTVIKMMDGRFFGKRKLIAEHWDGKTKYKVAESESEVNKRLTNWDTFLESDEQKETLDIKDKKSNDIESSTNPKNISNDIL